MDQKIKLISEFLENKRLEKDISIYRIAKDLETNKMNISRIFSGQQMPGAFLFMQLCNYLEVTKKEIHLLLTEINFKK